MGAFDVLRLEKRELHPADRPEGKVKKTITLLVLMLVAFAWVPASGEPQVRLSTWSPSTDVVQQESGLDSQDLRDARIPISLPAWKVDALLKQRQEADTCSALWEEPFYYLWEFAQVRCEATQCEFTEETYIYSVSVVWNNYGDAPAEKEVQIFVNEDAGGLPGDVVWSIDTTTTLIDAGGTETVAYVVDPPLGPFGPGSIWFGHVEPTAGPPSSLFDGVADGSHAAGGPPCGTWWVQDLGDYMQFLNGSEPTSVRDVLSPQELPGTIRLERPVSPVVSELRLQLTLVESQPVRVSIISPVGSRTAELLPTTWLSKGEHHFTTSVEQLPAGMYFLTLEAPAHREASKILVLH